MTRGLVPPSALPAGHLVAAILCVGVTVNLHITLLLDRIEACCMGGASWFALKGVLDLGGGSLGMWDGLGKGPVVVCRLAMPPGGLKWRP